MHPFLRQQMELRCYDLVVQRLEAQTHKIPSGLVSQAGRCTTFNKTGVKPKDSICYAWQGVGMARVCRRGTRRVLMRLVMGSFISLVLLHVYYMQSNNKNQLNSSNKHQPVLFLRKEHRRAAFQENDAEPAPTTAPVLGNATCSPKKGVIFLKTHKTASTTVTNILLRYAEKHRLAVGLPLSRRWELGGYPAKFNPKIVEPQLRKYDVLCHHMRYDHRSVRKIMSDDAVAVTILREPSSGFESGFSFFRDWPYPAWFDDATKPEVLQEFLNNPRTFYNSSTPWYFRAKNYMTFDLGFDHEREDRRHVRTMIQNMNDWFNLVMITERLEESLILLKDLLCMDSNEDILNIRLKVRQTAARRELSSEMRQQIRGWNFLDTQIYDYYNKTLDRKIDRFGKSRMERELKEFRSQLISVEKRCVEEYDAYDMKPWVSRIRLRHDAGDFCRKLTWGEVKFGDHIRDIQKSYVSSRTMYQPSQAEMKHRLLEAQRKVIGDEGVNSSA